MDNNNSVIAQAAFFCLSISLWYTRKLIFESKKAGVVSHTPIIASVKQKVVLAYSTVTGTAKVFANKLSELLLKQRDTNNFPMFETSVTCISEFNEDNLESTPFFIFVSSTCSDGTAPETATYFLSWLKDMSTDFRINKDYLKKVCYSGFGLGGLIYGDDNYCKPIKEFYEGMDELGGTSLLGKDSLLPYMGDDQTDLEHVFNKWSIAVIRKLREKSLFHSPSSSGSNITVHKELVLSEEVESLPYSRKNKKLLRDLKNKSADGSDSVTVKTNAVKVVRPKFNDVKNQKKSAKTDLKNEAHEENGCCGGNASKSNGESTCCKSKSNDTEAVKSSAVESSCCSNTKSSAAESSCCGSNTVNPNLLGLLEEEEEDVINNQYITMDQLSEDEDEDDRKPEKPDDLVDLEDLGKSVNASTLNTTAVTSTSKKTNEMVTNLQRKALTKEGYRIIGTHSAVKMCRWTKNQMRGRGGCYKHSFYGITSYQCMEATPSLACANKCVFCWRHHKNPVGTEWRWKEDDPEYIVDEAIQLHQSMVNEMTGVPGVVPDRLKEAFTVRHCALSLVGEPIMYPKINTMVKHLHDRKISTFLVTNGQFPELVTALSPVTQLYVSIDAASKTSLKAIDRPLFKDFWERYLNSLKNLSKKAQRTVYRMTLVKSWNMGEVEQYAELIEYGTPDFIEIKSVTYCGKSDASSLTMENVPWHVEVCNYAEAIVAQLNKNRAANSGSKYVPVYGIATEHQHSCCILIANADKFKVNNEWHTWIDYNKFDDLIADYYVQLESIKKQQLDTKDYEIACLKAANSFKSTDYMLKTPVWALYQSSERGFDPDESRFRKNKQGALVENDYKPSGSGCG